MTLQHRVQDVVDELVASGTETGMQVAVHHRGHRVVAGVADGTTGRPVTPETLFFCFLSGDVHEFWLWLNFRDRLPPPNGAVS